MFLALYNLLPFTDIVFVIYLSIARDIIQAINSCGNLHFLNLEGNTLGVDAAKGIAKALESHSEFKRALWKDMFTGRMKTEIPKALVSSMTVNDKFLSILCVSKFQEFILCCFSINTLTF